MGSEDGIGYGLNSETSYSYKTVDNQTSTLVDKYSSTLYVNTYVKDETLLEEPFEAEQETINSFEYHYQYDANGNITRVFLEETYDDGSVETSTLCRYTYDDADQLIREDNAYLQKSFKYIYDCGGNISSRKEYAFTEDALGTEITNVSYGYDNDSNNNNNATWNDKLINYNGQTISYDSIGNPLNIVSKNQSGDTENMTAEWNGRQLSSLVCSGEKYVYEYNSDGLRTATKIYNNSDGTFQSSYRYLWDGDKYLGYIICSEDGTVTLSAKLIYDGNGNAIGYIYENENNVQTPFYYGKNLQGDITAVYDSGGALLVTYNYDAWGNVTPTANGSSFQQALLAIVAVVTNPIAYRGYQFDVRTGLYYLQSRYYNPSYGRFINADSTDYLGASGGIVSYNLFAYCENDPVNCVDASGTESITYYTNSKEYNKRYEYTDDYEYNSKVHPGKADYRHLGLCAVACTYMKPLMPNAAKFYQYFLDGKGGTYTYDYWKVYTQESHTNKVINAFLKQLREYVEKNKKKCTDKTLKIYSNLTTVECKSGDWFFTLHYHKIKIYATANYSSKAKRYTLKYKITACDRYNFQKLIGNFNSIKWSGDFVSFGWAKFFTSVGTMTGKFNWR